MTRKLSILVAAGVMGGGALTYSISGTVYDADGSTAVVGATVALGALSAVSAADGTYTISSIPPATSGSLTCTKSAYSWTAISISAINSNLTSQNFNNAWWAAGGSATNCVAVYQPLGAASLAASYVNQVNPGTNDATTGSAPLITALGWLCYSNEYLRTGLVAANGWSAVARFGDVVSADATTMGLFGNIADGAGKYFGIAANETNNVTYYNGSYLQVAPRLNSGVLAVAGNKGYRNGVADAGTIGAWSGSATSEILMMAFNYPGLAGKLYGTIQVQAFYSSTLTAPQVAAVSAAAAALSIPSQIHLLAPMPLPKEEHGFEECGGKLYAVGGGAIGGFSPKKLYEYDPVGNTWATKTDLPFAEARRESAVFRAVSGKLYFIGGYDGTTYFGNVYEYDPVGNTWTEKTAMPTVREDMGSAVVSGKIYVFGGITTGVIPTAVLEIYDPALDSWDTTKSSMPAAKILGDFGAACGGKVYAIGGQSSMAGYPVLAPVTTVYCYDPGTDTWSTKSPIPVSTCYKEVEVIGNNLYVISGAGAGNYNTPTNMSSAIYVYNTLTDTWTSGACNAPYAVLGSALTVLDGKIYMCGGAYNGHHKTLFRIDL